MVENSEKKEKGEETKKTVLDEVLKELKQPPETPEISRKKYFAKSLMVIVTLSIVVLVGVFLLTSSKPERTRYRKEKARHLALPKQVERETWMMKEGARIGSLEKRLRDLQNQNRALEETLKKMRKQESALPPLPPLPPVTEKESRGRKGKTGKSPFLVKEKKKNEKKKEEKESCPFCEEEEEQKKGKPSGQIPPPRPPEQKKTIKEWEPEKAVKKLFLPPGSFVKGTLLAGVDAPASVSAQQTPYPVLVRLTDYAVLPNDFITDIRACVIVGSAYGDISSERVYIRSESLACIREDEELFSVNIDLKADAVGEDGKLGLRGKVVSKEGQMIGRAIISGFISGISDVLRSATRVTWYPLADWEEDVHRPSMGESFQAAGLGGIGKAADLLAKYYIDMMKRIYPVIEIEAGREITFVIIPPGAVLENENYYEIAR